MRSGNAPLAAKLARIDIASATCTGIFPCAGLCEVASWSTIGMAVCASRSSAVSTRVTGPTGGSVAARLPVARSTRMKTSRHQAILSAGSCVGLTTCWAASCSCDRMGMEAVREGTDGGSCDVVVVVVVAGGGGGCRANGAGGGIDVMDRFASDWANSCCDGWLYCCWGCWAQGDQAGCCCCCCRWGRGADAGAAA